MPFNACPVPRSALERMAMSGASVGDRAALLLGKAPGLLRMDQLQQRSRRGRGWAWRTPAILERAKKPRVSSPRRALMVAPSATAQRRARSATSRHPVGGPTWLYRAAFYREGRQEGGQLGAPDCNSGTLQCVGPALVQAEGEHPAQESPRATALEATLPAERADTAKSAQQGKHSQANTAARAPQSGKEAVWQRNRRWIRESR